MNISCEIDLRWMPQTNFHDESIAVQVMVWCYQAINHYPNQSWPRPLFLGFTGLEWFNSWKMSDACNMYVLINQATI